MGTLSTTGYDQILRIVTATAGSVSPGSNSVYPATNLVLNTSQKRKWVASAAAATTSFRLTLSTPTVIPYVFFGNCAASLWSQVTLAAKNAAGEAMWSRTALMADIPLCNLTRRYSFCIETGTVGSATSTIDVSILSSYGVPIELGVCAPLATGTVLPFNASDFDQGVDDGIVEEDTAGLSWQAVDRASGWRRWWCKFSLDHVGMRQMSDAGGAFIGGLVLRGSDPVVYLRNDPYTAGSGLAYLVRRRGSLQARWASPGTTDVSTFEFREVI